MKHSAIAIVMGLVIGGFYAGKSLAGEDGATHWDHSGGNLVTLPGINNVGIGTNSPAANLEVSGSTGIIVEGNNPSLSLEDLNDAKTWRFAVDDRLTLSVNGSEKIRVQSDGDVGIGTNSPAANLHVSGSTGVLIEGTVPSISLLDVNDGPNTFKFAVDERLTLSLNGSEKLRVSTATDGCDGCVGIGTNNPTSLLDVDGNVEFGGTRFVVKSSGRVGIDSANPDAKFVVDGLNFSSPGSNPDIVKLRGVTPAIGFKDDNDPANWLIGVDENLAFSTATDDFSARTPRVTFASSGRVGIGTSSPSSLLDVDGNVEFGGTRFVVKSSGRVGIDSANPDAKFVVDGLNFSSPGSNPDIVKLRGVTPAIGFKDDNDPANWLIGVDENLAFSTATDDFSARTPRVTFASSGRVGIGTSSPSTALDVEGQIRIRGGNAAAGRVLTSSADGTATWEDPSGGAQGSQGKQGPQGAQGKQGDPGTDAPCADCADIEAVVFDAVCKLTTATSVAELTECVMVLGQIILIDGNVCPPNETDCLDVILANVDDLVQQKQ